MGASMFQSGVVAGVVSTWVTRWGASGSQRSVTWILYPVQTVLPLITPLLAASMPSVRAIVLFPSRYLDQKVTVTGQFGARNLVGDLPDAPGKSRYDFVLRSADAAVWVTNLRPRG